MIINNSPIHQRNRIKFLRVIITILQTRLLMLDKGSENVSMRMTISYTCGNDDSMNMTSDVR